MPFYHVRLFYYVKHEPREINYEDYTNLTRHHVIKGIVEPYLEGIKFKFGDTTFDPSEVADISIYETEETISYPISFEAAVEDGDDVSDEFLHISKKKGKNEPKSVSANSKNVFIVHGRDHEPMKELKTMLLEFGLNPIVLHEQPSGSRTIVEKLEKHSDVGYAFVILTPDDMGNLKQDALSISWIVTVPIGTIRSGDKILREHGFKDRSRQNVVLEFGYFIGLLGRDRVCCLHKGDVELPSDMQGIVYIPFENSVEEIRIKIMKELKEAGYEVKI
jgi:predicted nucleotide-binding protein